MEGRHRLSVGRASLVPTRHRQPRGTRMTTTQTDASAILAKVRKLLAKAEDPATTAEEAETYNAKASELIAGYGFDRALLALADPSLDIATTGRVIAGPRGMSAKYFQTRALTSAAFTSPATTITALLGA